jgi:hypothetical protein
MNQCDFAAGGSPLLRYATALGRDVLDAFIEFGKLADMVLLDRNVVTTRLGGKEIYASRQ